MGLFQIASIGPSDLDDPLGGLTTQAFSKEHTAICVNSYNSRSENESPKSTFLKNIAAYSNGADPLLLDAGPIIDGMPIQPVFIG